MLGLKRDKNCIFGYPPELDAIDGEEIWSVNPGRRPLAFYIHIPFCKSICSYCAFNKCLWKPEAVDRYLAMLKKEIQLVTGKRSVKDGVVIAGYLGGGTPACLGGSQLKELLEYCFHQFNIVPGSEITIEGIPDCLDDEKLDTMLKAGINRLSLGVQSFDDDTLKLLGCGHRARQALHVVELAIKAGFNNVGVDLLYRIPGQTLASWKQQLQTAIGLEPSHITIAELAIEPGTTFYEAYKNRRMPARPGEPQTIEMYEKGCEILNAAGYHHYNLGYDFSLPGKECLFNRMNWEAPQEETLGLGLGAYSYINGTVYYNVPELDAYNRRLENCRLPAALGKKLSPQERMARYMVHGIYSLRVPKNAFAREFGLPLEKVYGTVIRKLEQLEWITDDPEEIILTPKGKFYINNVSKAFYEGKYDGDAPPSKQQQP
jgi:oxygen-independent coproporphyrinogen-3 oxidase